MVYIQSLESGAFGEADKLIVSNDSDGSPDDEAYR